MGLHSQLYSISNLLDGFVFEHTVVCGLGAMEVADNLITYKGKFMKVSKTFIFLFESIAYRLPITHCIDDTNSIALIWYVPE